MEKVPSVTTVFNSQTTMGKATAGSKQVFHQYLKPWFHVKIKLFSKILVFYFNTEPRLK